MASSLEFVGYVCDQMKEAGLIEYKKMFGEFGIYCNGKIIGLVCDNQLFIKETEGVRSFLREVIEKSPYQGAKPAFLIDSLDDKEYLTEIVKISYKELPEPKPKKKK